MKIKIKLLIFIFIFSLLAGATIILASQKLVHNILIDEVAKRGLLKADSLAIASAPGFSAKDENQLLGLLQTYQEIIGATYGIALDTQGRVIAHTNVIETGKSYNDPVSSLALYANHATHTEITLDGAPLLDISLPIWRLQDEEQTNDLFLLSPTTPDENLRIGTLRFGIPLNNTFSTLRKITYKVILVLVITSIVVLMSTFFYANHFLKRLNLLTNTATKIAEGNYGVQIPTHANDEIGELTRDFNQMSAELLAARSHLESQVKTRTQELESFVYTVSHDLKSPVVSIQGMASIFLKDYSKQVDTKGLYYLERIIANANFMEQLIQDLLALSRIGRKAHTIELVPVRQVIEQIIALHKDNFAKLNIAVTINYPLPDFAFDRVQLLQIFQNLITNAAKFMGDQPQPGIEIGGHSAGDYVQFYVKDNGIGIDPAYHDKIFGIFQRLKEVEVEGTGVGLAITKKIMDMAGGKLWVESQKGKGATFYVQFKRPNLSGS